MSRRGANQPVISLFSFQDIITSVTGIMILVTLILGLELISRVESSPQNQSEKIVSEMEAAVTQANELQSAIARNTNRISELQQRLSAGSEEVNELAAFDLEQARRDAAELERLRHDVASELTALLQQAQTTSQRQQDLQSEQQQHVNDSRSAEQLLEQVKQKRAAIEKLKQSKRVIFNPTQGDAKSPWLLEISATELLVARIGAAQRPQRFANAAAFTAWARQRDRNVEYFVLLLKPDGISSFQQVRATLQQLGFDIGYDLLTAEQTSIDREKGAGVE